MEENEKVKMAPRIKEKRQLHNEDNMQKKGKKHQSVIKNDLPQTAPSQVFDGNSPVKKLFCEANKIVKIGMEKKYALLERETTLQNSNETIENLRKNMLHLQMQYEKLDQNFQREISYRLEIVNRMDATRELVESVVQCSNVLSVSLKQLEDDKLKIAEYYELIYQKQKEAEAKHVETEKFIKEQDDLLKIKMQEINKFQSKILSQNSNTISQLSKKLTETNDKLKLATSENENLQRKIQGLQESSTKLQTFLKQQEKLNSLHQENVSQLKQNLKKLKIHRFKCQKLLKNKKKQFCAVVNKNKNLKKTLEKTESLYHECISNNKILQLKDNEWRNNFENHLEEREIWEAQKQEFMNKLTDKQTEIEDLKEETKNYNSRILELTTNEGTKQLEVKNMQNDLSKILSENLRLKEDVAKISEENNDRAKIISELELKSNAIDAELNSRMEFYKNECEELKNVVGKLESQLFDVQTKLEYEKTEKKQAISDLNSKLEDKLERSSKKIVDLEKLLEDKVYNIKRLEADKNQTSMNEKTELKKLKDELQLEKSKNNELTRNFNNLKESNDELKTQLEEARKEISCFEEKLRDLDTLNKTLTRTQSELEKNVDDLKKEIEFEKNLFRELEEKYKKTEKDVTKIEKITEENSSLKSTNTGLKVLLEATEVKLEAYKIAVRKLECEKIETKEKHTEEVSKLKLELSRLEEATKEDKFRVGTPQNNIENTQQNKKEPETPITRSKEKTSSFRTLNTKENEPQMGEKWHQSIVTTTSPLQSSKKFLSTPRKIFTSTPQPSFRNITPVQKKRDPYEFDSDSSVERFDQDKVLKVVSRQKRDTNKRSKTNK